jgi:hypothetical protein
MLNEILHFTVLSLVGSLALVFISKVILNKLLRRNVNYYEGTEINEEMELIQHAGLDASYLERRTDDETDDDK